MIRSSRANVCVIIARTLRSTSAAGLRAIRSEMFFCRSSIHCCVRFMASSPSCRLLLDLTV
ncbi:Uncharacterised protein [Bordetella pertussis]|nr:Uncharacterised protein [Bordetella pertussis]